MRRTAPITLGLAACLLLPALPSRVFAAAFTDIGAGLTGLFEASVAWGDYDNDGDLDIVVAGRTAAGPMTRIYRNAGGVFTDAAALPTSAAVKTGAVAWGDFDRDGDLDLAIAGDTGAGLITRIYRNDSGTFNDLGAGLEGLTGCAVGWGDFDNDGDLDLAAAGSNGTLDRARIYRNTPTGFVDTGTSMVGVSSAWLSWADYDLDGDLDLIVGGFAGTAISTTLYRNSGGTLSAIITGLPGIRAGSLEWSDFDRDGDPDLALTGNGSWAIYRNISGSFVSAGFTLGHLYNSVARWGDYDNDGYADLLAAGSTGSIGSCSVLHNNAGTSFTDIIAGIARMSDGDVAWGDYDNDGDLDLMEAGTNDAGVALEIHRIYRLTSVPPNTPPTAPTGLSTTFGPGLVTFHWNAATDPQGAAGLTYNLWAGTAPGTANVMSPMSNLTTGRRRVVQSGNTGQNFQWSLSSSSFPGGQFYWGVQAVDQAFAGSAFATTSAITSVGPPAARPLALAIGGPNPSGADSRITFTLPQDAPVDLAIYDLGGRRLQTLASGAQAAGMHVATWDGAGGSGSRKGPGLYFVRLAACGVTASVKLVRIQ